LAKKARKFKTKRAVLSIQIAPRQQVQGAIRLCGLTWFSSTASAKGEASIFEGDQKALDFPQSTG
jgi:hypothetical protein